jgi:hypothetical protein
MFHGPVSDRYWGERFRLVAVNMESYGYGGHCEVDRDTLIGWLYEAGKSRTVRRTLAILAVLNRRLLKGERPTWDALRTAYADKAVLENTLDRICYYNVRTESNTSKEQDFGAIAAVGDSDMGRMVWAELRALDPHVILVSGQAGLAALNGIARLMPALSFRGAMRHPDGFIIQSIAHPSRPHYAEWAIMVEAVAQHIERVEPGGAANRSQPVGPEPNRTSPAAGSSG